MKTIGISRLVVTLFMGLALALVSCTAAPAPSKPAEAPKQEPKQVVKEEPKPAPTQAPKAEPKQQAKEEPKPTAKPTPKPQVIKMRAAYAAVDASFLPLWVTKEAGLFEKNALDVELLFVEGGTKVMQALIGGDLQVAGIGGAPLVSAALGGADVVQVATGAPVLPYKFVTVASINEPKDLKGKTVGVSGFGSASHFVTVLALQEFGLKPDEDVTIVQTGGLSARLSALQTGANHGTVLSPPILYITEKMGLKVLGDLTEMDVSIEQGALAVNKKYMRENEEAVRRFVRAFTEGIHYLKTQKQFSVNVMKNYLKMEDAAALDEAYEFVSKKATAKAKAPYVTEKGMRLLLEQNSNNPKAATANVKDFYDNRFVKELDDSGFIKKLYGE
ncbi:MAG: ABC transporter substrate-binding protein [Chloroflexi bacterium]|nr:ABC transporter substrate-binding protein [Chloroflexota bacterium]